MYDDEDYDAEPDSDEGADYRRSESDFESREFARGGAEYARMMKAEPWEKELRALRLREMADEIEGYFSGEPRGARTLLGSFVARFLEAEPELLALKMLHIERTWDEHEWPEFQQRVQQQLAWLRMYADKLDPKPGQRDDAL